MIHHSLYGVFFPSMILFEKNYFVTRSWGNNNGCQSLDTEININEILHISYSKASLEIQ